MYIGILGGSFNPVHTGHLRLALEALENAGLPDTAEGTGRLSYVDMVPCAQPPHKPALGLLPFDLRMALLQAAVRGIDDLRVNALEGRRLGPSYTWHTLEAYRAALPQARLTFIVGGEDFGALPQWYRGLELPRLADVVMVPRVNSGQAAFRHDVARHWPEARLVQDRYSLFAELPWGSRLIYLPLPRMDISASDIRQRWLAGRSTHLLLPDAVLDVLEEHRSIVSHCWGADD